MFPQLFLIALSSLMPLKCSGFLTCGNDTDCQNGYSCIQNICRICVKCSLIFRKGKTCENDFNDCGDCLEGYKEISVTDNSAVKKPCRPMNKRGKLRECAIDNNCPQNHYCSEKSCVKCFDCSLLNRFEHEKCAKDPDECGPCFVGYHSVRYISTTNHTKCERFSHDRVPFNIASGSVLAAVLVFISIAVSFAMYLPKIHRGFTSSKTIHHDPTDRPYPSAPPLHTVEDTPSIKYCNEKESPTVGYERQKVQQARVFKQPCALYYPKDDEISEVDSELNENRPPPASPTSGQREETIDSNRIVICGECVRMLSRRLSEVNSNVSHTHSEGEQSTEMNVLNSDSAEDNSILVSEDPSQVSEAPANESTGDLSLGQDQV